MFQKNTQSTAQIHQNGTFNISFIVSSGQFVSVRGKGSIKQVIACWTHAPSVFYSIRLVSFKTPTGTNHHQHVRACPLQYPNRYKALRASHLALNLMPEAFKYLIPYTPWWRCSRRSRLPLKHKLLANFLFRRFFLYPSSPASFALDD